MSQFADCQDELKIWDGAFRRKQQLGTFCAGNEPKVLSTTGSQTLLDIKITGKSRFALMWKAVEGKNQIVPFFVSREWQTFCSSLLQHCRVDSLAHLLHQHHLCLPTLVWHLQPQHHRPSDQVRLGPQADLARLLLGCQCQLLDRSRPGLEVLAELVLQRHVP